MTTTTHTDRPRARGAARALVLTAVLAALSFVALSFVARAAPAGDDAEDRYHEAYALEIVDGKIAEAARAYLALVDDAAVPAAVRAESRFRFAVCAALLGRSDEARALLAALANDESASESLRTRAREYRKALADVGIGKEIDKKLAALVFELGRVPIGDAVPPVYRDFAVLGDAARPFLVRLLGHSDGTVRRHAMRILCRMEEPDLMNRWTPAIGMREGQLILDIWRYVAARPAQLAALEERLLALDDDALERALTRTDYSVARNGPTFSMDFVRTLRRRGISTELCFKAIDGQRGAAKWTLLVEWSGADDAAVAAEASRRLLAEAAASIPEGGVEPGRLELWTRRTLGVQFTYFRGKVNTLGDGLRAIAARASVAEVHAALDLVIESSRGWSDTEDLSPAERGLGTLFAGVLEERAEEDGFDAARLARSLTQLVTVHFENMAARSRWFLAVRDVPGGAGMAYLLGADLSHLRRALARLAGAELDGAVAALLGSDLEFEGMSTSSAYLRAVCLRAVPLENVALVPRVTAVLEAVTPGQRAQVLRDLVQVDAARGPGASRRMSPGMADVLTAALPSLVREAPAQGKKLAPAYLSALTVMEPAVAQARHVELVRLLAELAMSRGTGEVPTFFPALNRGRWLGEPMRVFAPALDRLYDAMRTPALRLWFVEYVLQVLQQDLTASLDLGADREALVRFTRRHYDLAAERSWYLMLVARSSFPIADWAPLVPLHMWPGMLAPEAGTPAMEAVARALTRDPAEINDSVVRFVATLAPDDVRREIIDRLLRETPVERLLPVVTVLSDPRLTRDQRVSPSLDAVEAAAARLAAADVADYEATALVAEYLAQRQPSERLFPAVRRLLARPEREAVRRGIQLANSLGRTELIPDLISKLDSMDKEIRTRSRAAIDAIMELERLRLEARRRFGVPGSRDDDGNGNDGDDR